jgi:hypothetical protein
MNLVPGCKEAPIGGEELVLGVVVPEERSPVKGPRVNTHPQTTPLLQPDSQTASKLLTHYNNGGEPSLP